VKSLGRPIYHSSVNKIKCTPSLKLESSFTGSYLLFSLRWKDDINNQSGLNIKCPLHEKPGSLVVLTHLAKHRLVASGQSSPFLWPGRKDIGSKVGVKEKEN